MPIGYLIPALLVGFCTCCALWPARLPGLVGYRFGFLINEAPFLAAFGLIASTLLALGDGDLGSALGRAGVALTAVVLVGLGVLVRRSFAARAVMGHVLPDALGSDWRGEIDPGRRRSSADSWRWLGVC
jgi:hypothetical protein